MTDISSTINPSSSMTTGGAGHVDVTVPDETVLSPDIRKAMDIIFPKSAVQLLQGECSMSDGTCLNTEESHENIHPETTTLAASVVSDAIPTSCASTGDIATLTTTSTVVGSTDSLTNATQNGHITTFTTANTVMDLSADDFTETNRNGHITTLTTTDTAVDLSTDDLTTASKNGHITTLTSPNTVMDSTGDLTNANRNGHITTLTSPNTVMDSTGDLTNPNRNGHINTITTTNSVMDSLTGDLTNANINSNITTLTTTHSVMDSLTYDLTNADRNSNITTLTTTHSVMDSLTDDLTNASKYGHVSTLTSTNTVMDSTGDLTNANRNDHFNTITTTNSVMDSLTGDLTNAKRNSNITTLTTTHSVMDSLTGDLTNASKYGHVSTFTSTNTVMDSTGDLTNANRNSNITTLTTTHSVMDSLTGDLTNASKYGHVSTLTSTNTVMDSTGDLTNANRNDHFNTITTTNSVMDSTGDLTDISKNGHATTLTCTNTVMDSTGDLTNANRKGHITTLTTTNVVMDSSTDVLPNAKTTESPPGLLCPLSTDSLAGALVNSKTQDVETDSGTEPINTSSASTNKAVVKAKITKADLEIISSCEVFNDESLEKTSRRLHSADLSSSECHSRGDSDSEDMSRPFASIAREKKKQKKKRKDSDSIKSSSSSSEVNEKVSTELKSASESCIQNDTPTVCPSNSNSPLLLTDFMCDTQMPEQNPGSESLSYDNVINKCTARLNNKDSDSQSWILQNGYVSSESFDKNSEIAEEISNISFSSTKENQNQRSRSRQKLPQIQSHRFNIVKHKKKIMNTFPPCFIVVKKLQMRKFMKDCSNVDRILPLSARLKHLSYLCDQGRVKCLKKREETGEELIYRNIFEETLLPEITEDDLNNSRRRNLRKRDKHISYVEPSEDDILDEFSRKRRRSKHKDVAERSEDESTGENKKRKKHTSLSESKNDTVNSQRVTSLSVASLPDSSDRIKVMENTADGSESRKIKPNVHKAKIGGTGKEIIVYPPGGLGSRNYYCVRDKVAAKSSLSTTTLQAKQKPTSTIPVSPPSTNITILPTTTISATLVHRPNPVTLYPSLPLSIAGSLPTQTLIAGAPFPTQLPTAGGIKKPPQYCVVKMDGKDVLLQIVSSGGIGTPVPVVVPKGKTLFSPSVPLVTGSHLFGQPLQQLVSVPGSTQALPVPLTSVVTVSQGGAASAASLQQMMGIQVISRPVTTSSQNVSLSSIPGIRTAQLSSLTSTSSVRPIHLSTSGQQISQSSAAGLLAPINVIPAANSGTSVTSISALPSAVTPMAAPNTTTVVRTVRMPGPNLRAVAPNQSTSLHSFRIFVPGCSATGMPSRFATLGSIANSSPLTHMTASSTLLPQRKRNSDLEMTPGQRAAKRRKLEKKYPLPPGVVIKTEPLDAVPKPSPVITTVSGPRSLLSQNLHLLSASRSGTTFPSIRIISPSLANSLSARNIHGNSNIIYRAASIGGGQTILLPTSLGQISTRTTTTVTSVSVTSSSPFITSSLESIVATAGQASNNTATNLVNSSVSSVISPVSFSSFRAISENNSSSPALQSTENTSTALPASVSSNATELLATGTSSALSVVITSSQPIVATNVINTISASPLNSGAESLHNSGTSSVAENVRSLGSSPSLASSKGPCEAVTLETVRNGVEELRKFIQVQEVCGLKGDRLEKLKELLRRKEEQYKDMLQFADGAISLLPASTTNGDIGDGEENNQPGGSEIDPFVID